MIAKKRVMLAQRYLLLENFIYVISCLKGVFYIHSSCFVLFLIGRQMEPLSLLCNTGAIRTISISVVWTYKHHSIFSIKIRTYLKLQHIKFFENIKHKFLSGAVSRNVTEINQMCYVKLSFWNKMMSNVISC